jgi:hypothetical protein
VIEMRSSLLAAGPQYRHWTILENHHSFSRAIISSHEPGFDRVDRADLARRRRRVLLWRTWSWGRHRRASDLDPDSLVAIWQTLVVPSLRKDHGTPLSRDALNKCCRPESFFAGRPVRDSGWHAGGRPRSNWECHAHSGERQRFAQNSNARRAKGIRGFGSTT